jgi:hypothetical protein
MSPPWLESEPRVAQIIAEAPRVFFAERHGCDGRAGGQDISAMNSSVGSTPFAIERARGLVANTA